MTARTDLSYLGPMEAETRRVLIRCKCGQLLGIIADTPDRTWLTTSAERLDPATKATLRRLDDAGAREREIEPRFADFATADDLVDAWCHKHGSLTVPRGALSAALKTARMSTDGRPETVRVALRRP